MMPVDDFEIRNMHPEHAPSTIRRLLEFKECSPDQQRAMLEAWVAWLNSSGANDPHTVKLRNYLAALLDDFDREQKGSIDPKRIGQAFDDWLETAGETGGPEREQDPLETHPKRWHSNPTPER